MSSILCCETCLCVVLDLTVMSARVFNPLVLSEMRRMIGRSNSDSSPSAVASVRRDLFGPINHEEAQSFVDRELATMRKLESEKWGFDFDRETPLENSKFRWERVTPEHNIPEAYALRRLTSMVGQKQSEESLKDESTNTTSTSIQESTQKAKSAAIQSHITGNFRS